MKRFDVLELSTSCIPLCLSGCFVEPGGLSYIRGALIMLFIGYHALLLSFAELFEMKESLNNLN